MSNKNTLIPDESQPWQPLLPGELAQAGQAANEAAARHRFNDYRLRHADQTLRRQQADLALFSEFLAVLNLESGNFAEEPEAWREITWGLVEAFIKWQINKGYAMTSINVRLSTIKTYARLAMQSGQLDTQEYALIRSVQGYSVKEQNRVDQRRPQRRLGFKKEEPVLLRPEQAQMLKMQPDTPQGRRDTVMMCLLLDHGLRVGELAALNVDAVDLSQGFLRFFRPKVNKEQQHRLSRDSLKALQAYKNFGDMPSSGPLLRRSRKDESLREIGMTDRAITQRVNVLGEAISVIGLSAHDCRHFWATSAARHGTDPFSLQQAGGWASLNMPRRYIDDNEISNEGVKLE